MKLRVFEAFSGYGSQSIALRNLGIEHEVVAISEIDKYAIKAYEAIHGSTLNLGDISKIDPKDIPEHDLFTYSFPCQDLSVAGKQAGLGKGTRSGLLYECEKVIEYCKPKYLLLENVKNLVGKKFKAQFDEWLSYLEGLGYTNYWQVLNAKHYGVPQNRERVFVVSILGEHDPYEFPKPIPLDRCIRHIMEDKVDEKYYLSEELVERFKISIEKDKYPFGKEYKVIGTTVENEEEKGTNSRGWVYDTNDCISTLSATDYKQPKQIAEKILIPQATKKGYIEMDLPGVCDLSYPNSKTRRGRVQEDGQIAPTLMTSSQELCYVENTYRIRKLTPRECFRLMGMKDSDIDKIQNAGISNAQQYKMAGNSIVVDVLEAIFENLYL